MYQDRGIGAANPHTYPHADPSRAELRDPLLASVNGESHNLLTAVCAVACRRRKRKEEIHRNMRDREREMGERERKGGVGKRSMFLNVIASVISSSTVPLYV